MAKDDLAGLGLDDDEAELIRRLRKERREESDREVRIRTADGHEATLPFGTAKNWLRKIGVLIDDEDPGQVVTEETGDPEEETEPEGTRRFGRRVS